MKKLALGLLSVAAMTLSAAADPIVYDQSGLLDEWSTDVTSEHRVNDTLLTELAADFVLDGDKYITDVHWWGGYWGGGVAGRDFRIRIYGDNGSGTAPGADPALYDVVYSSLQCNETPWAGGSAAGYEYNLDLDSSFMAQAGVTYWLSIQSVTGETSGQWGWAGSYTDNGTHGASLRSEYFGYPNWTDVAPLLGQSYFDTLFYLTGTDVPAPGALALLGLAGLVRRRRR